MPIPSKGLRRNMAKRQSQSSVKERQGVGVQEPRNYKVEIYNDDFSTMDFVVRLLRDIFYKSDSDAENIMKTAHSEGKALVGIYSYDIAKSRVGKAMDLASEEGFPLRLTYKPE